MTTIEDGQAHCSMCRSTFDLRFARPILRSHQLKTHEVYRCPHCGYYVPILREPPLAP